MDSTSTITNTQTGSLGKGQAVSGFSFSVSGFTVPTGFTELKGGNSITASAIDSLPSKTWSATSGTALDDFDTVSPFNLIDHWGFQATGSNVLVATAASPTATGNAQYMILPSAGTAGDGNSLTNSNFDPFIIGPADFFLTVPGMTANFDLDEINFSNVKIEFGTGPDTTITTTYIGDSESHAPEPASLIVWSLLGMASGISILRSRKRER